MDRYSAYKSHAEKHQSIILAFCWAHAQRDFRVAGEKYREVRQWAQCWEDRINELFHLNNLRVQYAPGSSEFSREDIRVREAVSGMHHTLIEERKQNRLHHSQNSVLKSFENHWDGLTVFVDHPEIPMDNNGSERRLRNPVVGRKNYYGSGAIWSARFTAVMFSIFETLELWQINQHQWLSDYFRACAIAGGKAPEDITAHLDYRDSSIERMRLNWAEYIVRFLTHPVVSSLLMSMGLLGLLIEIRTPGWGIGGTIGLIALALFFGSHYIVNLASLGELLIFSVGIILLTLEVFVIPGFGIAGVSGIVLIFLSLYLSLVGKMPEANDFMSAALTMGGAFLLAVAGGAVIIKILPKTALFNKLTLGMVESADIGFESAERKTELIGTTGITLSDLRPAGKIFVDGSRIDVVTQGEYIKKDTEVIVIEAHGARVVVKEK